MQKDMHYSAVYVMARLVGIERESAHLIASASQFVDQSRKTHFIKYSHGHLIEQVSTAHSVINLKNFSKVDQRNIWIPFHFLPGNIGESTFERFLCRKDSEVAHKMLDNFFTNELDSSYYLEFFGIMLHIYMDTFSHYGFSGINSPYNHVHHRDIKIHNRTKIFARYKFNLKKISKKPKRLGIQFRRFMSVLEQDIADRIGALGHSSCAHLPDVPYLHWSFKRKIDKEQYEHNRLNEHDFFDSCEKTFYLLKKLRALKPGIQSEENISDFSEIKRDVVDILRTPGRATLRTKAWEKLLIKYHPNERFKHIIYPISRKLSLVIKEIEKQGLKDVPFYRFSQAANIMQVYILRKLLPEFDLYII